MRTASGEICIEMLAADKCAVHADGVSNGATPPTATAVTPPTDTPAPRRRPGRLIWGWSLLGLALTRWAGEAALMRLMPQSWGGSNIGGGLRLLIAAGLGITGALLLLFHYSDPSREPRI